MSSNLLFIDSIVGHEKAPFFTALFVSGLLFLVSLLALRGLKKAKEPEIPSSGLSSRTFFHAFSEMVIGLGDTAMGKENRKYLPFLASLFVFLLFLNMIGLIPGFLMPTDMFQFNMGIALAVFGLYNYWGIKEVGIVNYLKHLCGPVLFIAPMLFVIEIISHCVRPMTLSLRLFGNMTGDHLALSIFTELTNGLYIPVPVIFLLLGTMVCFIQAFVFTLLTMIYIRLAVAHEH